MNSLPMKSVAWAASRMKPRYQTRKKIVAGTTKRLRVFDELLELG